MDLNPADKTTELREVALTGASEEIDELSNWQLTLSVDSFDNGKKLYLSIQTGHFPANEKHRDELAIPTIPVSDFSSTEPARRVLAAKFGAAKQTRKGVMDGWMVGRRVRLNVRLNR